MYLVKKGKIDRAALYEWWTRQAIPVRRAELGSLPDVSGQHCGWMAKKEVDDSEWKTLSAENWE